MNYFHLFLKVIPILGYLAADPRSDYKNSGEDSGPDYDYDYDVDDLNEYYKSTEPLPEPLNDVTLDSLKAEIERWNSHLTLPRYAVQRFKNLLENDHIGKEDFIRELHSVLTGTNNLKWKIPIYLNHLRRKFVDQLSDQLSSFSFLQIFSTLCFFLLLGFLYLRLVDYVNKKFTRKEKKILKRRLKKYTIGVVQNILIRFIAFMGYYIPMISLFNFYLPTAMRLQPLLSLYLPDFIDQSMTLFYTTPYSGTVYFFVTIILCCRVKRPKPRFIRFHFVRGLLLYTFQQVPELFQSILFAGWVRNPDDYDQLVVTFFTLNLMWLLPAMLEAILYKYPNAFLREAIEVQLGRDDDPDFIWWDRKKR